MYVQLNEHGEYLTKHSSRSLVAWDANNFCTPEALTKDGKAEQFRVYPLQPTNIPTHNPIVQSVREIAPVLTDKGHYEQQWEVQEIFSTQAEKDAAIAADIEAKRKASVPSSVTMRQARLALLGAGLLASVDAAIDSLPSPQKEAARIEWEYATEVQRSSGLVSMMGVALGLDDAALDALFIEAAVL